ncbi:MAG: tripartite tricarboxylate transporter substrate binding protein [Betaproteobacteria bacterium]|nr:MAG: tripartite tricarboxylate transporter substrate binding protein [Betaproteobacteria bacterium]
MNRAIRLTRASVVLAALMFASALYGQQAYPSKPIRFISPYSAGGATSVLGRLVGQRLTESWGQQVLIDNRPGGSGVIAAEALLKAAPDGHTIMLISGSAYLVAPLLIRNFPFDAVNAFAPVATMSSSEVALLIHRSVPANDMRELIALAKARPGQLNYSTAGRGGMAHLAAELFGSLTGTKLQEVAYKGANPAVTELLGGQVHLSFQNLLLVLPHIKSGRLKAIAITGEKRSPALPMVPTFKEAGVPGMDVKLWYGVLAPAATPKEIVDKLSREIAKILVLPDTKEKLDGIGMDPYINTPEQFGAMMRADTAKYAKIIKAANIKLEN